MDVGYDNTTIKFVHILQGLIPYRLFVKSFNINLYMKYLSY